jgi:hypothetical protein
MLRPVVIATFLFGSALGGEKNRVLLKTRGKAGKVLEGYKMRQIVRDMRWTSARQTRAKAPLAHGSSDGDLPF